MAEKPDIKFMFEPRSVAVIGASSKQEKIGYKVLRNIVGGGFQGRIYPINPGGGMILDKVAFKSVDEIDDEIDLGIVSIPAKYTFDAVKECADKGVKYLAIITSGFSEVGKIKEEQEIVDYCAERGTRVIGPNIIGVYTSAVSLNATFGPRDVNTGNVAIITQSGALGIAMMGKTKVMNIGLSALVSCGNKADVDEAEMLEYLIDDDSTRAIMMYIEGVKNGDRLVPVLKRATRKKPVVVIKSGSSKRGAVAAASHTGSLAGSDAVFSDIMAQCGVIRAESIDEALRWCKYLASSSEPCGKNAVIITNGGGMGVLATDACEKYNVQLYDDLDVLKKAFAMSVPEFGSTKNPVDITGQATLDDYENALEAAAARDDIHSIICLGCETATMDAERLLVSLDKFNRKHGKVKPAVFSFFGGAMIENAISNLMTRGVPIFYDVYEAVGALGVLYEFSRTLHREPDDDNVTAESLGVDVPAIEEIIKKVRADNRLFLLSYESAALMSAAGIRMPQNAIAHNSEEAVRAAEQIGYPVVMKVVSKDIIHKSDAGGVALDLLNTKEVEDAYDAIMYNCKKYKSDALIEGVEIAEQVKPGTETIIGARIDHSFGPTVMFGLGGIYVEVMKDVAFRAFPLGRKEALAMISEIKSYPLLLGVRGEKRKDINLLVDAILKVGAILYSIKDISDIEINPLIAYDEGDGAIALDARILLKPQQ
ncbi:MAG TPA: acetate--CoA ligase family protein [bacterium]|nr:acetate--CoA ligase family protein [bacterium]